MPLAHPAVPDIPHTARPVDQVARILCHWHDHWCLEMPELGLLLTVRHFAEHATRFQALTSLRFRGLQIGEPLALFSRVGGQGIRTSMNFAIQKAR